MMRQLALRAVMLLLLPLGMVLMHQVPLPAPPAAHASTAAAQHGGNSTSAVPDTGSAEATAPDARSAGTGAPDAAAPDAGPAGTGAGVHDSPRQSAADQPAAHTSPGHQPAGQQSIGPEEGGEHPGAGCGWLLHLCMAVLTAALGMLALRSRGARVVPQRGTPVARSPRVLSRPRPPPHPYVLCVLRL